MTYKKITPSKKKKTGPKTKESRGGRPTIMTEVVLGKLMAGAAYDMTIEEMSLYAGINPDTYYEYVKKNKRFAEKIRALRETPVMKAREKVIKDIDGNVDTAKWYLERKRKNEFSQKVETENTDHITVVMGGEEDFGDEDVER